MAHLLFRLKHVPDDEADEVRRLLEDNGISYYETPESRWGTSVPAIWLRDDSQRAEAVSLLREYQERRTSAAREDYARRRREGTAERLVDRILARPFQFLALLAFVILILYFSLKPFITLG